MGSAEAGGTSARRVDLEGVLHFPAPLFVDPGALGQTYDVVLAGTDCTLRFPTLPPDDEAIALSPPDATDPRRQDTLREFSWGYVSLRASRTSYVETALLRFSLSLDLPPNRPDRDQSVDDALPQAREFLSMGWAVPAWFIVLSEWLEVWTGQALNAAPDPNTHSSHIHAWEAVSAGPYLSGTGIRMPAIRMQSDPSMGATAHVLTAAFEKASVGEGLPTEHRMLRAARTAAAGGDTRRAVIDAATAAEVALSQAITRSLDRLNNTGAVDNILGMANGLVDLMRLHESLAGTLPVSRNRAMDRLAKPRNQAAHSAAIPDKEATQVALTAANDIVNACSPVPSP